MRKLIVFMLLLLSLNLFSFEELNGLNRKCGMATKEGVTHPQFSTYEMNCETFEHIIGSWYKDKDNVYFYKANNSKYIGFEVINDMNPENVKLIGESLNIYYISDGKNIYIQSGDHMEKANENINIKTFKVLEKGYAMDNKKVYYLLTELENADVRTFEELDRAYSKDKKSVYYGNRYVKAADSPSFRVYGETKKINNIDYDSEDKNNYYLYGKIVKKKIYVKGLE